MYIPKIHISKDPTKVIEFIKKYSFATVIVGQNQDTQVVHIPIEVEIKNEELYLSGHVAIANDIAVSIKQGLKATVIFMEPHAYISSSWYDHVNVPTWNYIAVHCTGEFTHLEGSALIDSIKKMVDHYEEGRPSRYSISDMPKDMLQAHLDGLIGFEMKADKIEAKFKLSQNRDAKNYKNIVAQLEQSKDPLEREIAKEMSHILKTQYEH